MLHFYVRRLHDKILQRQAVVVAEEVTGTQIHELHALALCYAARAPLQRTWRPWLMSGGDSPRYLVARAMEGEHCACERKGSPQRWLGLVKSGGKYTPSVPHCTPTTLKWSMPQ